MVCKTLKQILNHKRNSVNDNQFLGKETQHNFLSIKVDHTHEACQTMEILTCCKLTMINTSLGAHFSQSSYSNFALFLNFLKH